MKIKATTAVREIMKSKAIGVNALASSMGKDPNGKDVPSRRISERLSQENISIKILDEMLRVLGYKITIVPRESRTPEGGYDVE